jgi:hypothetical protein
VLIFGINRFPIALEVVIVKYRDSESTKATHFCRRFFAA